MWELTESLLCFIPTPRLSVLTVDTDNAAWGTSGPPQRPHAQRYTVVRLLSRTFFETAVNTLAGHFAKTEKKHSLNSNTNKDLKSF